MRHLNMSQVSGADGVHVRRLNYNSATRFERDVRRAQKVKTGGRIHVLDNMMHRHEVKLRGTLPQKRGGIRYLPGFEAERLALLHLLVPKVNSLDSREPSATKPPEELPPPAPDIHYA
jgi:hypothetical protein